MLDVMRPIAGGIRMAGTCSGRTPAWTATAACRT